MGRHAKLPSAQCASFPLCVAAGTWPLIAMRLAGICGRPVYSLHDPALQLFAYSNGLGSQRFIPNTSAPGRRHSRIAAGIRSAPELPVGPVVHPTF